MEALLKVFLNLALMHQVISSPQISLEYNPYPLPSYNPNPGQNTAHTVPPGKPWPANPEDYNSFSQTSSIRPPAPPSATVENRFQETTTTTTSKPETTRPNLDYGKPPISLEYNPYPLPSYNPNPGQNTALTVPPGKPWPANPEGYNEFSQTSSTRPKPLVENRIQETTTNARPNQPPASLEYNPNPGENQTNQSLNNRVQEEQKPTRQEVYVIYPEDLWFIYLSDKFREMISKTGTKPTFVFDYKPNRPSPIETTEPWLQNPNQSKPPHHQQQIAENQEDQVQPLIVLDYKPPIYRPSPTEIPPGEPLPVNPEDYAASSQIQSHQNIENRVLDQVPPLVVLDYKPNRPFYRPSPTEIQQIIPPGQPWPANPEDYATFGQGSSSPPPIQSAPQEIENRFQEVPPDQVQPLIVLDYKPNRPFYRPSPTEVQQIVPPGKPWPANQEDYATFSQSGVQNRLQEIAAPPPDQVQPLIVLDYKPNRPFYRPSPTEVQQVVPPGKPLPAAPVQQTIENLFKEVTTPKQKSGPIETKPQLVLDYKPTQPNPEVVIEQETRPNPNPLNLGVSLDKPSSIGGANENTTSGKLPQNQKQTNEPLEYYPVNSINQGTSIGQIVRPGKPWPGSIENHNSTNLRSTQDITETKAEDSQPTTEDVSQLMLFTSKILKGDSPTSLPLQQDSDKKLN